MIVISKVEAGGHEETSASATSCVFETPFALSAPLLTVGPVNECVFRWQETLRVNLASVQFLCHRELFEVQQEAGLLSVRPGAYPL